MALTLSPDHEAARTEAARLPALQASYGLLTAAPGPAKVQLFEGSPDTGTLIVTMDLPAESLTLDEPAKQIKNTAPIEGQAVVAGAVDRARILDGAGSQWGDATVTDEAGSGDIKLQTTTLQAGGFARLTSAIFQG